MARKKSLWSELQHELERRQRAAQARERTNEQTIKQIMRDHDHAGRQATRSYSAWVGWGVRSAGEGRLICGESVRRGY